MNGLLGLTKSIKTRESAVRDLSVLERMDARVQGDRQAEVQAQQQEQMFYERMYASADQLLEKDRMKINKKVLSAQKQVREHLSTAGGSRKKFMEQGGMSAMNEISNGIIRSDEAITYQENKKNLAKILEAKEKNLGHLLTPTDLKSLEAYDGNPEGGRITYGGMMSEVEIPPSANFDYGTDIPLEKILSHGSNMMKIMNNYATNYPDRPTLDPTKNREDYHKLVAFAKKMGYGGTGSNTTRIREKMTADRQRAAFNRKHSIDPNKKEITFTNEINKVYQGVPKGMTMSQINKPMSEGGYDGDIYKKMMVDDPKLKKLIGNKVQHMSRQRDLSEKGLDVTDFKLGFSSDTETPLEYLTNDKMGLKSSYEILPHNTFDIAQKIWQPEAGFTLESGELVDFTPTEDMYRMDGMQLNKDNALDPDDHKGRYKILGITTAMKSHMDSEDQDALLVNAYNDNGEIDKDATATLDEGYSKSVAATTVIAMENENGDVFYKEIDLSKPQIREVMSNAMGDDNDMTDAVTQENNSVKELAAISKNTSEEKVAFEGAINTMNSTVFEDELFKSEGERYWGAASAGQNNRYPLMKSFYMAFDYIQNEGQDIDPEDRLVPKEVTSLIDKEIFTTSMIDGEIDEELKDYSQGNSEGVLIQKWLGNMQKQFSPNSASAERYNNLASKWYQMFEMME